MSSDTIILERTKSWIDQVVIGLQLCPFAEQPYKNNVISYHILRSLEGHKVIQKLLDLITEMVTSKVETGFLILPDLRMTFSEFFALVTDLNTELRMQGEEHTDLIAFHPEFYYDQVPPDATENATNRSPYPMIHLLNKMDLEKIVESGFDVQQLLEQNRKKLSQMTWGQIHLLYS